VWPPARDPYYNQTVLHLSGDVAATRETNPVTQPRTFLSDASPNNFLLTPNGDVSARPFNPYGGTNYSVYFPGGTARVQFPSGNIIPASGTYTIECWIYPISLNATYGGVIASQGTTPSGDNGRTVLSITAAGVLTFGIGESFPSFNSGSNVIKLNQWTHVAITRNNTVFTMYINGNRINQVTSSKTTDSGFLRLGTLWDGDGNGLVPYVGYISNFRIVYSVLTDFTNRTDSLAAISNTALLTCQSNRFIDNSSNNYLATIVGGPQVSDNSPFVSYDTTNGSGYFDGSGDYLSTSTGNAIGTNAYTLELWVYFTASGDEAYLFGQITGGCPILIFQSGSLTLAKAFTSNIATVATSFTPFTWHHLVAVRNVSGNTAIFVNGSRVATGTDSTNYTTVGSYIVGGRGFDSASEWLTGYISNARFVIGSAVYDPTQTSLTIPTAPLQPITGTSLLTCQTRAPANNQGILDTSPNSFVVTRNGNVAQGSFSPFSQSGWSAYFDGTGDYVTLPSNAAFAVGTGDFTFETWVYPTVTIGNGIYFIIIDVNTTGMYIGYDSAGTLGIGQRNSAMNTTVSYTFSVNVWTHLAVVRSASTVNFYINGVSIGSGSNSVNYSGSATTYIGGGIGNNYTGYLSNYRIIKGTALYTSNFTVPTSALGVVTNTSVMTFNTNRFRDLSTNNFTITPSGDAKIVPFSPFAPTQAYVASQLGGSAYFDSSGDSLTIASAPVLNMTGDFCMEGWAYPTAANITFAWKYVGGNVGSSEYWWTIDGTNQLSIALDGGGGEDYFRTAANTITLNAWNHCVVTRVGTAVRQFINGVLQSYNTTSRTLNITSTNFLTSAASGYISGLRIMRGSIPDIYQTTATTTGTAVFTPPTAPPISTQNTSLLLNFTGAGIVDSTGKNVVETVGNSAVQTSQSRWPPGSMYFDGTSDYLKSPSSNLYVLGTGDWTMECWVYLPSVATQQIIFDTRAVGTDSGYTFYVTGSAKLALYTNNTSVFISSASVSSGSWAYLAMTRLGATIRAYINGTLDVTTATYSGSMNCPGSALVGTGAGVTDLITGYIQDLRITRGYARYVTGTGANANQMVFNGTNTLALPNRSFPLA
jgi:hypothetical protein